MRNLGRTFVRCRLICIVLLSWVVVSHATERQSFLLNPGWNLITFQVLPANHQASHVFSSMEATDGSGARLFDPGSPGDSVLRAAFALDSLEHDDQVLSLAWRVLEHARYTNPETLSSSLPFPELDHENQHHKRAGSPLHQIMFGEAYFSPGGRNPSKYDL